MSYVKWGKSLSDWFNDEIKKIQIRCEKKKIISIWDLNPKKRRIIKNAS